MKRFIIFRPDRIRGIRGNGGIRGNFQLPQYQVQVENPDLVTEGNQSDVIEISRKL